MIRYREKETGGGEKRREGGVKREEIFTAYTQAMCGL